MSEKLIEIEVESTIDGSMEKNLLYYPEGKENVPLVVGLHTWSLDRFNQQDRVELCEEYGWALLLPEFRGPNLKDNPRAMETCGSKLACQDIIDATNFVCENYSIDSSNIFLFGGSGGGHMALMMAAYKPEMWCGVSSWCPITDVALWYENNGSGKGYAPHLEACCGGAPGESREIDYEYSLRSPMSYLSRLTKVNALSVHHGRFDHVVPYIHTYNLAVALEKLGHPRSFFEIFDGRHDIHPDRAFKWFDSLYRTNENSVGLTG